MAKILNFKGDYKGLDSHIAQGTLDFYGYNCESKHRAREIKAQPALRVYGVFKHLRFYLMLAAVFVYFLGGDTLKGVLLLFLIFGLCTFEIVLENLCAGRLKEVTDTCRIMVRVVRDGEITLIKREQIVQDDLIILQGGENVPADAHILEASDVTVDESAFTKSAAPVKKHAGSDNRHELKHSCVYKGTKVLSGLLIARVSATGQDVKIRSWSGSSRTKALSHTELESFIKKLSIPFTYAAAIILVVVFVVRLIALGGADPQEGQSILSYVAASIMPAFSFALCAIPVSLALIVRFYYVNAAMRLAYKYGNVRRLRAIETLSSVTVVCLDKDMTVDSSNTPVASVFTDNKEMLARISALSCDGAPANSYEKAININAAFNHIKTNDLRRNTLIRHYPPEQGNYNNLNGNLWDINGARLLCVKGSPEKVISFCKLNSDKLYQIQEKHSKYAKDGHHVQGIAFAQIPVVDEDGVLAEIPKSLLNVEYTFMGLIAFSSTINDGVAVAVQNCYRAGVRVVMLTDDNEETALAIAHKAGINKKDIINKVHNYIAKIEVVDSLKASGEIVAAFGKDNSDTVALELSDVGICLCKYTTEHKWDTQGFDSLSHQTTGSACEACDLIFEEDAFAKTSIAFREARLIHRNIKRCISVAIATFIVIFLFGLVNLTAINDYVLEAVFVSTLTVLVIPAILTFFFMDNAIDSKSSTRPSAFIGKNKINKKFLTGSLIQGMSLFAAAAVMFILFRFNENYTAAHLRSIFMTLFTAGVLSMAWVSLSYDKPFYKSLSTGKFTTNIPAIMTIALLMLLPLIIYLPYINSAFGLAAINIGVFVVSLIIGAVSQIWFDFIKKRFFAS
jgi:Ca2+-transporting ATPase